MSRARRAERDAHSIPDPHSGKMIRAVVMNRIGLIESMREGKPHVQVYAHDVSLADVQRILTFALASVEAEIAKAQRKLLLPPDVLKQVEAMGV